LIFLLHIGGIILNEIDNLIIYYKISKENNYY